MRKRFTLEEANATLPYVSSVVREARERYRAIRERGQAHNQLPRAESEARTTLREEIKEHAERLHACMEELERIGVELKDYDLGLVDFPAEREGREVLLCWKYGEDEIRFWHDPQAGFAGRQPV